ncbi:MAG TPA: hypothetical protein VFR18_23415, partial [Terriglobia bacterium]|nr:hypothetical protein [Terriglobia bacterium]
VHVDPRWPGSLAGSVVGIAAAILMQAPFLYLIIKRIGPLRRTITRVVPMGRLLAWHIYGGILGPILALIHSGHKFDSSLGVALVTVMLIEVGSGFVGRYLLGQVNKDRGEKMAVLAQLRGAYQKTQDELSRCPGLLGATRLARWTMLLPSGQRLRNAAFAGLPAADTKRLFDLAVAIADVEGSIAADEFFRTMFARWLRVHIAVATLLECLLVLHIWTGTYFGLRWL